MSSIGFDIGGVNTLACLREGESAESFFPSEYPERPSVVLLPMSKKENPVAGKLAIEDERGSGQPWPPLAQAPREGWKQLSLAPHKGRVLLAAAWNQLEKAANCNWTETEWTPPDGLPTLEKTPPAECIAAELKAARSRVSTARKDAALVLAIPNGLPEAAQDALIRALPRDTRLVWRSIAVAMNWANTCKQTITPTTRLVVVDCGVFHIEISVFEFETETHSGKTYAVPVRHRQELHTITPDSGFLADTPPPYQELLTDKKSLNSKKYAVFDKIRSLKDVVFCGPLGKTWHDEKTAVFTPEAVAQGAALFGWRLKHGLPTYLEILPSLELFTLNKEDEPQWKVLIPDDAKIRGGEDYQSGDELKSSLFIKKGTPSVVNWLKRSGEKDFRKLTTRIEGEVEQNAYMDLKVTARSAGGFARIEMKPSAKQPEIFGTGKTLELNWQNMESSPMGESEWPVNLQYGYPKCGKLYAYEKLLNEFLECFHERFPDPENPSKEAFGRLGDLKVKIESTTSPKKAGIETDVGNASPVNQLLCFSGDRPCQFLETKPGGKPCTREVSSAKQEKIDAIGKTFWKRLKSLINRDHDADEKETLIRILGRMGGSAPNEFRNFIALELTTPSEARTPLQRIRFAAGRVLESPEHGKTVFQRLGSQENLNNDELKMIAYLLYQREAFLSKASRQDIVNTLKLVLDALEKEVNQKKFAITFTNSLRSIALLLRARRPYDGFLEPEKCPPEEKELFDRIETIFASALEVDATLKKKGLKPLQKTLIERIREWIRCSASTQDMPPIDAGDEEE